MYLFAIAHEIGADICVYSQAFYVLRSILAIAHVYTWKPVAPHALKLQHLPVAPLLLAQLKGKKIANNSIGRKQHVYLVFLC